MHPLKPSVAFFCKYLNRLFATGASWSKCSSVASALSTTVFMVSGYQLSSNPMVALVKKSIRAQRLPSAAYTDTWDVSMLFVYLRGLGPTHSLSNVSLLCKWVCLLKVDLLARSSDLERIFVSNIRFVDKRLCVRIFKPKEWRAGNKLAAGSYSKWLFIDPFPKDKKICCVATAQEVVKRFGTSVAKDLLVEGRYTHGVCTSVVKRPVGHLHEGMRFSLTADRISAIFLRAMTQAGVPEHYKAHSSRSAAISAASVTGFTDEWLMEAARISSPSVLNTYYRKPIREGHSFKRQRKLTTLAAALRSAL